MDLSPYIKLFWTSDDAEGLVQRVEEALQWFASTPEGLKAMQDAVVKHHGPLAILVGHDYPFNAIAQVKGIGTAMILHPDIADQTLIITKEGQQEPYGLKAVIAHEYEHARQDVSIERSREYNKAVQSAKKKATETYENELFRQINSTVATIMTDQEIRVAISKAYHAIYDPGPVTDSILAAQIQNMENDPVITSYVDEFEAPAIAFENRMREKYGLGSQRDIHYIRSAISPFDVEVECSKFMDDFIPAYRERAKKGNERHGWQDKVLTSEWPRGPQFDRQDHPLIAQHQEGGRTSS